MTVSYSEILRNREHSVLNLPEPYYDKDGITLYCADARDIVPCLEATLLLTDPPYGIDGGRGGGNRSRGKGRYESSLWDDTPDYVSDVCVPVIALALERTNRGIITPGTMNLGVYSRQLPQPADIGCLWTPASEGFGTWGANTYTPILYYGKDPRAGAPWPNGKQVLSGSSRNIAHPCPKPLAIWQWLMAKGSVDVDDVVLDPFCGSGTTLVAAKNLGRRAIGVEIEERYCKVAVERLRQEVLNLWPQSSML